jgi:hypothetical protein
VAQCGQPAAVRIALTDLMLELQTGTRPSSSSGWFAPPADDQVRRFLIESEQRVIVHCRKLLDDENLPTEERRRLTRLLGEADARLQGRPRFTSGDPKLTLGKSSQKKFAGGS